MISEDQYQASIQNNNLFHRVWHPTMDFPGTAFSRSIGDSLAEELGVIADPEMVTRELERGDEMIILASDGVFEFLTNQSVIDICASFKDPLEGKICSSIDFTLEC